MKVYVVSGYNGLLQAAGAVGVADTLEGAEKIKQEHEYILDQAHIDEMELQQAKTD